MRALDSGAALELSRFPTHDFPPAPHDPREREPVISIAGWQVRLFTDARFRYFVPRGLWHVQLWHDEARISVLTRSTLTKGAYEVFPIANWKRRASTYEELRALIEIAHGTQFISAEELGWIEKRFVKDIVRTKSSRPLARS